MANDKLIELAKSQNTYLEKQYSTQGSKYLYKTQQIHSLNTAIFYLFCHDSSRKKIFLSMENHCFSFTYHLSLCDLQYRSFFSQSIYFLCRNDYWKCISTSRQ